MVYKQKLSEIRQLLKENKNVQPVTIRELLSWFGYMKRTYYQTSNVKAALDDFYLATEPEFDRMTFLDTKITFKKVTWKVKPYRVSRIIS